MENTNDVAEHSAATDCSTFPRTRRMQMRGWVADVIDCTATPPPPVGYLRCMYCGELRAIDEAVSYDDQCVHRDCPTGVHYQNFMGNGWRGWDHSLT